MPGKIAFVIDIAWAVHGDCSVPDDILHTTIGPPVNSTDVVVCTKGLKPALVLQKIVYGGMNPLPETEDAPLPMAAVLPGQQVSRGGMGSKINAYCGGDTKI